MGFTYTWGSLPQVLAESEIIIALDKPSGAEVLTTLRSSMSLVAIYSSKSAKASRLDKEKHKVYF